MMEKFLLNFIGIETEVNLFAARVLKLVCLADSGIFVLLTYKAILQHNIHFDIHEDYRNLFTLEDVKNARKIILDSFRLEVQTYF